MVSKVRRYPRRAPTLRVAPLEVGHVLRTRLFGQRTVDAEQRRFAEQEDDPRLARFVDDRVGEPRLAVFSMGKLVRAPVKVGIYNLTREEILSGLSEGDTVALSATTDNRELTNGLEVTPIE